MIEYMVIGLYADNDNRFAASFWADTPQEAEKAAMNEAAALDVGLLVAGVLPMVPGLKVVA